MLQPDEGKKPLLKVLKLAWLVFSWATAEADQ